MNNKHEETAEIPAQPIQKEWLTPNEASEEYKFSTSTLAKWRMDRLNIPFSKIGKYIRYKRSDIIAFLESSKVEVAS